MTKNNLNSDQLSPHGSDTSDIVEGPWCLPLTSLCLLPTLSWHARQRWVSCTQPKSIQKYSSTIQALKQFVLHTRFYLLHQSLELPEVFRRSTLDPLHTKSHYSVHFQFHLMPSPVKFHINIFFVLHVVQFTAGFKETSTCRSISMTSLRKSPKWTIDKDFMLSTSCTPQSSTVQWSTNCTVLLTNLLILPPRQTGSRLTLSIEYKNSIWTNNEDGSPRLYPMKAFDCQ